MSGLRSLVVVGGLALVLGTPRAQAQVSFQGLGSLPGANPGSVVGGISGDGQVVVGSCTSGATCSEAWRWTSAGGIQGLGFLPGDSGSNAVATSSDGAVVFGGSGASLYRWTSTGMVDIGAGLPSGPLLQIFPTDLSSDGLVAVGGFFDFGTFLGGAFRWTSGVGIEILIPFGIPQIAAFNALSSDGTVIVGSSGLPDDQTGFFRTNAGGITFLPELPFGECQCGSDARGVSEDGQTIVGTSHQEAFRWTAATGTVGLGLLAPIQFNDFDAALDVSADGSVVVGFSSRASDTAFIWTEASGILDLRALLSQLDVDMTGWTLTSAVGVSNDGTVIVGNGINPSGDEEAWIASVPEIPKVPAVSLVQRILLGVAIALGTASALRRRA